MVGCAARQSSNVKKLIFSGEHLLVIVIRVKANTDEKWHDKICSMNNRAVPLQLRYAAVMQESMHTN